MNDETFEERFEDLLPHIMASGALWFAEHMHEFRGSQRPLTDHFKPYASEWMSIRGHFEVDHLLETLDR